MSHQFLEEDNKLIIQKFTGEPRKKDKQEKSRWRKFIDFLFPWLEEKREQGERFLAAKVAKEEAEAFKLMAEGMNSLADANLKIQQSKRIAEEVEKHDEEKAHMLKKERYSEEELQDKLEEIEEKIQRLFALYGTKIEISLPPLGLTEEDGLERENAMKPNN